MKTITGVLFFLLSLGCAAQVHPKERKNDLETDLLKGKVKSVRDKTYTAISTDEGVEKGSMAINAINHNFYKVYNAAGYTIEDSHYQQDKRVYRELKTYDSSNLCIMRIQETFGLAAGDTLNMQYVYNKKGRIIQTITTKDGEPFTRHFYLFDEMGRLSEVDMRDYSRFTFTYDQEGNMVERHRYTTSGELFSTTRYQYNAKGREILYQYYGADGVLREEVKMEYDSNGQVTERETTIPLTGETRLDTYSYTYDDRQNWVCQVHKVNGKAKFVAERIIDYYL